MITVYSKPNCMQCEMTKMWLEQHNIDFEVIDTQSNPEALELIKDCGWQQLPVVSIDNEIRNQEKTRSGFQVDKLEGLIR